jgi:hypothetical protein
MNAQMKCLFAVCLNNEGYQAALEVGKLYRVVPDEQAAAQGYLRIIDESGEDYGYAADRFFPLELPPALEKALSVARPT